MRYGSEPWYDVALVCLSGHVVNDRSQGSPQHSEAFCSKCGASTVSACSDCKTPIRGYYHSDIFVIPGPEPKPPAYCHHCGSAYPWTSERLAAAQEMARELEELSAEDRELLAASLAEIMIEGPRTELAASRVKRLLAKAGPPGAALYRFVTDVGAKMAVEIIRSQT